MQQQNKENMKTNTLNFWLMVCCGQEDISQTNTWSNFRNECAVKNRVLANLNGHFHLIDYQQLPCGLKPGRIKELGYVSSFRKRHKAPTGLTQKPAGPTKDLLPQFHCQSKHMLKQRKNGHQKIR